MFRTVLASGLAITVTAFATSTASSQPADDATVRAMATMQASLIYATDKCRGTSDPNAEAAVAMVAQHDPQKMKAAILAVLVAINKEGERIGAAKQCRNIVEAFGPTGTIKAGAWRPAGR